MVPEILRLIKNEYLGVQQQNIFDDKIRGMKMKPMSLTRMDLEKHYTSFAQILSNILICDSKVPEYQYVVLYKKSLPLAIIQLITGDIDTMTDISVIQDAAMSAITKLSAYNVSQDRIRKPKNSTQVKNEY